MNNEIFQKIKTITNSSTPLFNTEQLKGIVDGYFRHRKKFIDLYMQHGGPLYVFERDVLRRKALEFRQAFESHLDDTGFFYAVKCNNHPALAGEMIRNGYGLDVSSGLELQMAIDQGAKSIVFSGPGKTEREIQLALQHADKVTILADSFREIDRIEDMANKNNTEVKLGVRLTTNPNALWRKFGIPPESLKDFWTAVRSKPHIIFSGLQFHTSWNLNPDAQIEFICKLGTVLKTMPDDFIKSIKFLDIGGGYWPQQGEWLQYASTPEGMVEQAMEIKNEEARMQHYNNPVVPIKIFGERISKAIHDNIFPFVRCKICFEPGRWICNDAVELVMSVIDKKSDDIVITDMGMNAVGWERFEYDYFPVLNLTRPLLEEQPCHILGCLCTPRDVWGYGYWGSEILEGDILLIPMQGAYTYSLRQNFIKPLPEFIIV